MLGEHQVVRRDDEIALADHQVVLPDDALVLPDDELVLLDDELVLLDDELVLPEHDVVLPDGELVLPEHDVVLPDGELVLPEHDVVLPDDELVLRDDELVVAEHEPVVADHERVLPEHERVVNGPTWCSKMTKSCSPISAANILDAPSSISRALRNPRARRGASMASTTTTKKTAKPMLKHVDRTTTAYTGPVKVDASAVSAILINLPPGARKGLRTAGPGIAAVLAELAVSEPADGAAAGISPAVYASMVANSTNIALLTALGETCSKLSEVITDTLAILSDQREQQLSQIADSVDSTAKRTKSAGIKAPFAKTLAYKAAIALKAAKTRKEKKAAAAGTTTTPTTTTPTAATPVATTPATAAAKT